MSEAPKVPFTGTAAAQVRNTQEVVIGSSGGCRNMPAIGMGTAADQRYYDSSAFKPAILEAIKHGYRDFDTAAAYNSEPYLGEAIAEALQLGLIASRDELFITSKLRCKGCSSRSCHPCSQEFSPV